MDTRTQALTTGRVSWTPGSQALVSEGNTFGVGLTVPNDLIQ